MTELQLQTEKPARAAGRPARARRALKLALGALAILPALAYLAQALLRGWIDVKQESLTLQTGEFHWSWYIAPRMALSVMGAAALAGLIAAPERLAQAGRGWVRWAAAGILFFIILALTAMQALGVNTLLPSFWGLALAAGLLAAWVLVRPGEARPLAARLGAWVARGGGGRTLALLAAAAAVAVMVFSWRVLYEDQPVVTDSQSQIAQARLMLSGHWRLEIPQALRDVICFPYGTRTAPSFSQYPPGYILALMPALALKLPPQAADIPVVALTAILTALLAWRLAGRGAAIAAGLLLLGSPFFMGLSGSGMNHSLTAALLAAAACAFIPAGPVRRAPGRLALLGGLCLGWAVMTRPVTGLGHALVWSAAWALLMLEALRRGQSRLAMRPDRTPRALLRQLLWAAAGAAIPAAIFLFYNYKTTGHPLLMGYQVSNPELHRLGFHGGALPFTPLDAWLRAAANCVSLSFVLFGWACGSWLALGIWLWRSRLGRGERTLAALVAVQAGLYTLYQYHDLFLGPRFLYELLPALAALAGAGLAATLRRGDWRAGTLAAALALLAAGGLGEGRIFWEEKLHVMVSSNRGLEEFLRAQEPFREPTVVVLQNTMEGEMIGRHFSAGQVWFVTRQKEAEARALPELAGRRWIRRER